MSDLDATRALKAQWEQNARRGEAGRIARQIARARDTVAYPPETPEALAGHPAEVAKALQSARDAGRALAQLYMRGFENSQKWCTSCWKNERGDHGGPNDLCTWCLDCCDPDLHDHDYEDD